MYVQAYGGSDVVGTGEKSSPVATLDKALDIVASKKAAGYTDVANIVVGDGEYEVTQTIAIARTDVPAGGLNIIAGYNAEPTFIGGVSYNLSDAKKVTDSAILDRLYSADAKNNLYELDLTTKVALSDIPALNYPGSYNVTPQLKALGLENPPAATSEIAIDGKLLTVARYPNSGYTTLGTVTDTGVTASYFNESYQETGEYIEPTLENVTHGFTANFSYDNLSKWLTADQAMMFGYWKYDWATQTLPLKSVDVANNLITAKYASVYTPKTGARFYIYNLLEEIDVPGEYFIDRKTGKLYFYMPENVSSDSKIAMSTLSSAVIQTPQTCRTPITIDGINVSTSMGTGISVNGSYNTTVRNCEVSNTASYGISAYGKNALIENCYVHDTNGGISLGSDSAAVDAKTLVRTNNIARNNEIENFSRINKTYTPAFYISAIGNSAINNEIHNGEGTAIMYSGQYNTISYNEIYNVCKEVEDAGAIYVGRSWNARGNKILSNYFHDIQPNIDTSTGGRSPVAGIFLDDHYAGAYIEGNVFENIYGDGIRGNGGREHTVNNNIFVSCSLRGVYMSDATGTLENYSTQVNSVSNELYQTDVWKTAFPELANIMNNNPEKSEDHVHTNNLYVGCGTGYKYGTYSEANATAFKNNYVATTDPGFVDMANKDYTLKAGSAVFDFIPNFVQVDTSKMGIQK